MPSITVDEIAVAIREMLPGPVRDALQRRNVLADYMAAASMTRFTGKEFEYLLHTRRNSSFGHRKPRTALPEAGRQGYTRIKFKPHYAYMSIALSGQAIEQVQSEGAAIDLLTSEVEGAVDDARFEKNRILAGDGTGTRALIDDATTDGDTGVLVVNSVRFLRIGQQIEVRAKVDGDTYGHGKLEITAIDKAAKSITVKNLPAETVPDFTATTGGFSAVPDGHVAGIYAWNERDPGRLGALWGEPAEPWGINNIDDSDTRLDEHGITLDANKVGGISMTAEPRYQATVIQKPGLEVDFDILQEFDDAVSIHGETDWKMLLTSFKGWALAAKLFSAQRRYVNTMNLQGGQIGLEFNGKGIFRDRDIYWSGTETWDQDTPTSEVPYFAVDVSGWEKLQTKELGWMPGYAYGGIFDVRRGENAKYDEYEASLNEYMGYAIWDMASQGVLVTDVATPPP